jgi:hypothetical protein
MTFQAEDACLICFPYNKSSNSNIVDGELNTTYNSECFFDPSRTTQETFLQENQESLSLNLKFRKVNYLLELSKVLDHVVGSTSYF